MGKRWRDYLETTSAEVTLGALGSIEGVTNGAAAVPCSSGSVGTDGRMSSDSCICCRSGSGGWCGEVRLGNKLQLMAGISRGRHQPRVDKQGWPQFMHSQDLGTTKATGQAIGLMVTGIGG
nr:hypothetical protein CFP56_20217 [Quercus suber]